MIFKIALYSSDLITLDDKGLVRTAATGSVCIEPNSEKSKIIKAEMKKHPTALFFRSKAIKADEANSNGDYFSADELKKAYKSFEGVPFFTNHDNQHVENAKGKTIFAEWIPEEKAIYTISFIDREAFPHLCRSIEENYISGVSMGAVYGNALITMSDLSEKRISDIVEGDIVRTAYGNNKKVRMVHNEFLGKKMYKFDLVTYHKSPLFTEDHPIYMLEKDDIVNEKKVSIKLANNNKHDRKMGYTEEYIGQDTWREKEYNSEFKQANQIQEGDYFLVPSKFDIKDGASNNSEFYYIIGAYLGDGYLKKDKRGNFEAVSFCFGSNEMELAGKITSILKSHYNPNEVVCEERNGLYINYYDRKLAKWFYDNFGTGSKDKRIKLNIDKKEDALNLLAGYLDTDGCVVNKVNANNTLSIQFSSTNIELLEDIQSILISLGAVSRISTFARTPSENSAVKVNTIENTLSVGSTWSNLFKNSIKHNLNNCATSKINADKTFITKINDKNYMACPVKSVSTIEFNEPVYDITVEDDENYIADGVAVHNCSVTYSVCNICGNKAEKTDDYCSHIRERKARTFTGKAKNVVTGVIKEFNKEPVFEYNYGIKFIELSAVVDPACPSCHIQGLINNDDIIKKVANMQNELFMKSANIEKTAGQEEIKQLNDVLSTLENISVQLIQNRQQIEVDFASDLVGILSQLQTFVDELVGAGYGNAQLQAIPGVAQPPANTQSQLPQTPLPTDVQPVASETPLQAPEQTGTISGAPSNPAVQAPKLPISAPAKPMASDLLKIQKIANKLENLTELFNNTGENDMRTRMTVEAKSKQKKAVSEVLSNSWQEKQHFFEYINKVPSIQDNNNKLSVKKNNDSFVIVAENKNNKNEMTWTYETLSSNEKEIVRSKPKEAALYFLDKFAKNLKNIKEGEAVMTSNIKEAGAQSVNKTPDVTQEAQLEAKGLYHSRTNAVEEVVTEKQLDSKREKAEAEVITEAQLDSKREKADVDVITETQLEKSQGSSPRKNEAPVVVTQEQLKGNRANTEKDVVTEKQLDSVDTPWSRAAKRDSAMFKSAGDHMKAVIDVMANTCIACGCTPEETREIGSSMVASTKDRFELGNAILDEAKEEDIDYGTRLAYWSKKNIKVAGVGNKEIAEAIVKGLRKVASDVTINPEVIIDALEVVTEEASGMEAISNKIDEKLAETQKQTVKVSKKDELRAALKVATVDESKVARDEDRKEILASVDRVAERTAWTKTAKKADRMIEASFEEVGCAKTDVNFKSALKSFARGALAAQNIKLAAITNVTISGDTISIAVQTDAGEESVEIPVGKSTAPTSEETVPEADVAGEGLGTSAPPAPAMATSSKAVKTAQVGGMGGGVPQTPGAVAAPGAPETALPGANPDEKAVQSLTTDDESPIEDDIPTAGEQQPPGSTCPECGSADVDMKDDAGAKKGTCNGCGAEYEVLIKKELEFKILKPTRSVGKEGTTGAPEAPEVPALPVAAQTKLDKGSIVRIATNKEKNGHVCPACGMKQCKASAEGQGHTEYHCPACSTDVSKDIIVNINNPDDSYLRVKWDIIPNVEKCATCKESTKKFASMVKVQGMMKKASASKFPMANCIERIARKHGGNAVASFGPCKGKPLADCVCGQLEALGLTTVRHLEKLASVYTQKDPMEECISDYVKKNYDVKEASTICGCMKKKYASKADDNVFIQAFAEDIDSGKEKGLTHDDLDEIGSVFSDKSDKSDKVEEEPIVDDVIEEDVDIGAPLTEEVSKETVTLEVSKETAQELADAATVAVEEVEVELEVEPIEPTEEVAKVEDEVKEIPAEIPAEIPENVEETTEEEKVKAMAMQMHRVIRVGEAIVKVAATPTVVKDIEGNVEAKVPRKDEKLGEESKVEGGLNAPDKGPDVPRKDAYMGKEKEADSLINKELKLPDVAVDSSYLGKEKEVQTGMPAINNEIKGTVIAKKLNVVETVEKDVEAKVPRKDEKLGEESKVEGGINTPNKGPDVPKAPNGGYMADEKKADSLINKDLDTPDVPVDNAYMGDEKAVQKDMPGISDKYLKNVQQKKDVQLERIAVARRIKAIEVTSKLLATKRISEEAYENVIEALSKFEIDKIASVADNMHPKVKKQAPVESKEVYSGPAIIMESKDVRTASSENSLAQKLGSAFTIGNRSFDEKLTHYGEK
jgi:hypothetical protein